jgi:four helix bundle protein
LEEGKIKKQKSKGKSQKLKVKSRNMGRQNFEKDLKSRCYKFSLDIISLTNMLSHRISSRIISDQLIRSATSIGANLIEAQSSSSRLEFKRFYEIALRSANETKYWLGLLKDAKLGDDKMIDNLLDEVTQIAKMIAKAIIKLKTLQIK